jgi:hypothetical protein
VQAWVSQDDPEGIASGKANLDEIIRRAMDGAMKGKFYTADYVRNGERTTVNIYLTSQPESKLSQDLQNPDAEAQKNSALGEL